MLSPVLLYASVPALGRGARLGVSTPGDLENPFKGPMLLDEIRIRVTWPATGNNPGVALATLLQGNFKLGTTPLTKGDVPIDLLGTVINEGRDAAMFGNTTGEPRSYYQWRLPKPLFIGQNESVMPEFYLPLETNTPAGGLAGVEVMYACRPLPPGTLPTRIFMPWVAAYRTLAAATSTGKDLVNPWRENLVVQRFMGRTPSAYSSPGDAASGNFLVPGQASGVSVMRMHSSSGHQIVRTKMPFGSVFNVNDRSWPVGSILPPRGYYIISVDGSCAISMVGYREIVPSA